LDFVGLEAAFIAEYCEDNLNDKTQTPNVIKVGAMFAQFNFDMLKALVEEMNRYNEPARLALRMLNAKPEFGGDSEFNISVTEDGKAIPTAWLNNKRWEGNPLSVDHINVHIQRPTKNSKNAEEEAFDQLIGSDEEAEGYTHLRVRGDELIAMFPQDGKFVFRTQDKYEVTLTRISKASSFHWDAF
jgi:hypothetical protein